MKQLQGLQPSHPLKADWCDDSLIVSALLEALSFVTPALELFFIRAVRDCIETRLASDLRARAQAFVREESRHSGAHRRLNRVLSIQLGSEPPSLRPIEAALRAATRRLSLQHRLLLVEVMEQGSAIASAGYLRWEAGRRFDCEYTRCLFAQHAREEIGHVSIIRDLRPRHRSDGLCRALAWSLMAAFAASYLVSAVPWIFFRKMRLARSLIQPHL